MRQPHVRCVLLWQTCVCMCTYTYVYMYIKTCTCICQYVLTVFLNQRSKDLRQEWNTKEGGYLRSRKGEKKNTKSSSLVMCYIAIYNIYTYIYIYIYIYIYLWWILTTTTICHYTVFHGFYPIFRWLHNTI